ncbi:conserved Plasmodium protein, unknown function [Plasmodium gonderi]|uniref:Uncharacterized protein n=1 Tax=Plasmodium gonderi TaxID=77519 RepID=A0A1Y1JI67_PLAGO|nr:conserved Plasmodium protein, unknown function [Plasmodium gonderi]GAW82206.1 conserved Plasmodium protein, unknown function [Plasmodium gonderi]
MFRDHFMRSKAMRFAKKKFFTTASTQIYGDTSLPVVGKGTLIDVYDNYEALKNIKKKSSLKCSLKRFREIVQSETKGKAYNFYTGWPPINRIKITQDEKLGLYGRSMFVFNRIKGVKGMEPNLCICCKNKNVLSFNKSEFESLLKNMDTIKYQLQEFAKKL